MPGALGQAEGLSQSLVDITLLGYVLTRRSASFLLLHLASLLCLPFDTDDPIDGQSLQNAAFGCQLCQNLLPSEEHPLPS